MGDIGKEDDFLGWEGLDARDWMNIKNEMKRVRIILVCGRHKTIFY